MYKSDFYSVMVIKKKTSVHLKMQIHLPVVNTIYIPHTYEFLTVALPNILNSECFNDEKLPFSIEVKNTELGHLFEHILLEKLCEKKTSSAKTNATFSGRTYWNWKKNPYGHFDIKIKLSKSDFKYLKESLLETISLFNTYLNYEKRTQSMGNAISHP